MKRLHTASTNRLKRLFFVLLAANVLYIILVGLYLQPLTSSEIIRFELAKDTATAESIIQNWIATGKYNNALHSIYLDFLFVILYTSGLSVACLWLSRLTAHEVLITAARYLTYLLMTAGLCDVIENLAMLRSLQGTIRNWNVLLAYDMAATKFSLLILAILFMAVCFIYWGLRKLGSLFEDTGYKSFRL